MSDEAMPNSEIILYQTEDGRTRVQCRFENETLWLTQALIAELFEKDVRTINEQLVNVFDEGELRREATIREFRIVRAQGKREVAREIEHYNLDAILAVGFRVRSHRGTQFRQWAIGRLNEYLVKGFTMDDERLKNPPGKGQKDYFDEQLERIRDIRTSERRFYQKVLDIYATSVDYTPNTEVSQQFFATVQNTARCGSAFRRAKPLRRARRRRDKMHWAAHGQTAAEPERSGDSQPKAARRANEVRQLIHARVDAGKPFMGLQTTRPGGIIRKEDVSIAKNYLDGEELDTLNRIVTAYIEFAELRALQRKVMTMRDWVTKLDEFLKLSEHELLDHAGKISAEQAKAKAELEYDRYRVFLDGQPRAVDLDFEQATKDLKKLPRPKKPKRPKP